MAIQLPILPSERMAAKGPPLKSVKIPSDIEHAPLAPASGTQKAVSSCVGRSNRPSFIVGGGELWF